MFPELTELLLIGCLIESIWTPKIQIKYIDTENQLSDMLTKRNFTCDQWNHLLCLFNIGRRTSHNEIAANDKSYCKGSLNSVIFGVRKPWEEELWKSESLECET